MSAGRGDQPPLPARRSPSPKTGTRRPARPARPRGLAIKITSNEGRCVMSTCEGDDAVRLSEPMARYAFTVHASGVTALNLRWLLEVIAQYEAAGQPLRTIPAEPDRLALLRTVVQHVDDDRLLWSIRHKGHA
jgi:hypothetical protein